MSNLPRRLTGSVELLAGREVTVRRRPAPARVRRATELGVAIEHGRAIVQAARIRGVERVAQEALHATGALAREEAFWVQHAPHAAGRLQAIADMAAIGMADIVSESGRD